MLTKKQTKVVDVWKNNKVTRKDPTKDEYYQWYESNKGAIEKDNGLVNLENPSGLPAEPVLQIGDFTLFRCPETGFMYFNPRLTAKATRDFFKQPFLKDYYEEVEASFEKRKEIAYKDVCQKIASFLKKGDSVLEVGCGTAPKLRILRDDFGFNVKGIEISSLARPYHEKHGVDVQIGAIEDAQYAAQSFDMIFMWSVADHFADPIAAFRKCFEMTRSGGYFLIAGINTDGFDQLITGFDNVAYRPPSRMNLYNIKALKNHLGKVGYEIRESYTPGRLDVAMVRDYWQAGGQNGRNDFLEHVVMNAEDSSREAFQTFLTNNGLSGFQVLVAQKK